MIRKHKFDREQLTPVVGARLSGRNTQRIVRLVFDTGAAVTQIHTPVIDGLGYSAVESVGLAEAHGPAGPIQEGYLLQIELLEVFGKQFVAPQLAVYDFDHIAAAGIDGLLGFDIIRELHLEMNGPAGELIIYS